MNVKRKKSGFTIVELLTVLAIIAMLVGLLVPALNLVRNIAKETKQKAQLTTIGLALTAFRNDDGDYPPSDWPPPGDYCGAQKLAEALLGRDLLGFHPKSTWSAIDPAWYPDPATTPPAVFEANLKERKGRYLELATTNAFKLGDLYGPALADSALKPSANTFVICDVFGVKKITLIPPVPGGKTDVFKAGTPILYYGANTSGKTIRAIYNVRDNVPLITQLKSIADGKDHPLGNPGGSYEFFYGNPTTGVIGYIQDPKITAPPWPYRPDSYILISAGLDGEYGTKDDIRNFGN